MSNNEEIVQQNNNQTGASENSATPSVQPQDRGVAIHSMPENFRFDNNGSSSAKTFGLLILIGGTFLIILSLFLLYVFVYKGGADKTSQENIVNQVTKNTTTKPVEKKPEPTKTEESTFATTTDELDLLAEETDLATTTATTTEEQINDQVVSSRREAEDTDGDGLFDKEEGLLGSDINEVDSDGDGYSDFSEVSNLYNPAGSGKLSDSRKVIKYVNDFFGYNLFYPAEWALGKVGGDDSIVLTSPDNQFVQIISQVNERGLSIEEWFSEQQSLTLPISSSRKVFTDTWQGVKSEDGLVVYITDIDKKYIFVVAYSSGVVDSLDYKNIFDMIVKSFMVK